MGPLIPLFQTSGDICPGFQIQDGSLFVPVLPACNGFLQYTSGVSPANLFMASIAVGPFLVHIIVHNYWQDLETFSPFLTFLFNLLAELKVSVECLRMHFSLAIQI